MNIQDFKKEVNRLKKEKDAFIMAHYYQRYEIQEVADFIGDSLELSRMAEKIEQSTIVFCGVYFMAEIAKILAPHKKVVIPYRKAGCLLADMAEVRELRELKERMPQAKVVAYVNTYADIKAEADIICTSANAGEIIKKMDSDEIIFVPDKNLGSYHSQFVDKKILLWNGYCPVHERITLKAIERAKRGNEDALVIVHPECPPEVTRSADFVGSTSQLVRFVKLSPAKKFVVGTEKGTLYKMREAAPDKEFILPDPIPRCDQMKMITPERLIKALKEEIYEVSVDEETAERAKLAIERMLE